MQPIVLIHGGAGTIAEELHEAALAGVSAAAEIGRRALQSGADAVTAAVAAVRSMEDEPAFNAGRGACMNADGDIEVDAGIMRSWDRRSGAVGGVRELRDPILLARLVMEQTPHCLLVGQGAEALARRHQLGHFGRAEVETTKARERWLVARSGQGARDNRADTVGAIALDHRGHLCAAGSTGGVLLKIPGRVGDTPIVGAGFYADPDLGACCCTGVGEAILTHMLAYRALTLAAAAPEAASARLRALCAEISAAHAGAAIGLILLRPDGQRVLVHQSDHMSWAVADGEQPVIAGLRRE
ncbi:MAG: isoaspartyl peptidase/L-asparaginase [Nannocystis sp.]|nr:isoaspartyl peptidase/L-asparaginase [Nannocystis sp.]